MTETGTTGGANKWEKLENPARVAELDPKSTLMRIGVGKDANICDIGAGSGVFSRAAAGMTRGKVYAVDTDADILKLLAHKAAAEGLGNLITMPVSGFRYGIADGDVELVLMVTALHEIPERNGLFREINRILKDGGRICVIEFRKKDTKMGPPAAVRLSEDETGALLSVHGFSEERRFPLGESMYCMIFRKKN